MPARFKRKLLASGLAATGLVLFVAAHFSADGTLLALYGLKIAFLCFISALIPTLLPHHADNSDAATIKPAPRVLAQDTLNDPNLLLTLPERIEIAIEMSKTQSRSLGVLSIRIAESDRLVRKIGAEAFDKAIANTTAALVSALRRTDRANVQGRGEILVCLPLIAVRRDLDGIAARLSRMVATAVSAQIGSEVEIAINADAGIAMYPIGGYSGEELIATAQGDAKAARAARLGRPVSAKRSATGPAPVMPTKRPTRPAPIARTTPKPAL